MAGGGVFGTIEGRAVAGEIALWILEGEEHFVGGVADEVAERFEVVFGEGKRLAAIGDGVVGDGLDFGGVGGPAVCGEEGVNAELQAVFGEIGGACFPVVDGDFAAMADDEVRNGVDLEAVEEEMGAAFDGEEGIVGEGTEKRPKVRGKEIADGDGDAVHGGFPFVWGDVDVVFVLEEGGGAGRVEAIGAGAGIAEFAAHGFDLAVFGLGGERGVGLAAGLAEEEFEGLVGVESGPLLAGGKALEDVEFAGARGSVVLPAAPGGIIGKEVALQAGLEGFVARMRPGKIV